MLEVVSSYNENEEVNYSINNVDLSPKWKPRG